MQSIMQQQLDNHDTQLKLQLQQLALILDKKQQVEDKLDKIQLENQRKNDIKLAADNGNVRALYILAEMYYNGDDPQLALKYITLAADNGNARAQYNHAKMYYNGDCTEVDLELALKYFTLASKNGYNITDCITR
eukprot:Pgem_evm1s1529